MIKSAMGSGFLTLPYVVQQMGIIMTIISYIIAGLLCQYSSVLLLHSKNMSGRSNLTTIMSSVHPNSFSKIFISGILFLGLSGSCNRSKI